MTEFHYNPRPPNPALITPDASPNGTPVEELNLSSMFSRLDIAGDTNLGLRTQRTMVNPMVRWKSILLSVIFIIVCPSCVLSCPSSCFCEEVTGYVGCVGDGIWDVPLDIPKYATRLELRNFVIGSLSSADLQDLTNLQELKLQQTHIQEIENNTFENLFRLERLDMSQNLLGNISTGVFSGLVSLRYLDLSGNQLYSAEEAFTDLTRVEQLNLRENEFPHLTARTFLGLNRVQYLNLDSNQIASIEVGTFQYLTNLAHLILSNNPLTRLTRLDFFGSRLQYIDISHVGLLRVPQSLTRNVRDLRLAKNNLTQIQIGDFDSYPYLSLLVLDDNLIADIENDALGRQEYLMRLWLNGNHLRRIPGNLPPSLRALYVEENLLQTVEPFTFKGLASLEQLFLQRNRIRNLYPCAFCELVSLKFLDLQANLIDAIPEGAFANLSKLEIIDLSQNPLKTLYSGSFSGLGNLVTLQMSRMKSVMQFDETAFDPLKRIETFEMYDSSAFAHQLLNATRALHGLRNLKEINIMHNNLLTLRTDFSRFFPQLKAIKMSGNSWICDRSILWLTNWIKKADVQFYRSYSIRCALPDDLQNRPIMLLTEQDFTLPTTAPATTTQQSTSTPIPTPRINPTKTTIIITKNSNVKITVTTTSPPTTEETTEIPTSKSEFFSSTPTGVYHPQVSMEINDVPTVPVQTTIQTQTETEQKNSQPSLPSNNTEDKFNQSESTTEPLNTTNFETTLSQTVINKIISSTESFTTTELITSKEELSTTTWKPEMKPQAHVNIPIERISLKAKTDNAVFQHTFNSTRKPHSYYVPFDQNSDFSHNNPTTQLDENHREIVQPPSMIVEGLVALGLAFVLVGVFIIFTVHRLKQPYRGATSLRGQMRRSNSISYYPQRDEVSIVTVSEGTVGMHTATHHGLGNKLYFMMQADDPTNALCDPIKDTLPDPDLHETLPDAVKTGAYKYPP